MESATLISIDNWAKENTDWYNTRKKLKTCLFIGIATTLIALFIEALVLLTIGSVLMILFFFLLGSSKPQPVRFPMYAGTIHNMIDWKGNYHFITKNPSYSAQFVIRQGIDDRTPHNPRNIESTDIWTSGDDEFHNLSVDSFHSFIKQEKYNLFQTHYVYDEYFDYDSSLIKSNPLLSIIIPTYNRYEPLNNLLKDLEEQTYTNFEVILIDQSNPFQKELYNNFNIRHHIIRQ
jgi:hypothetical protein